MRHHAKKGDKPAFCPWAVAHALAVDLLPEGPQLERVRGILRARNLKQVTELGVVSDTEYHTDSDIEVILALRQIAALFKKNAAFSDAAVCNQAAMDSFHRGEVRCRITNKRLTHFYRHPGRMDPELREWMGRMERDISRLLGGLDAGVASSIFRTLPITSGATEDRGRRRAFPFLKITGKIRCAPRAVPWVRAVLATRGVDTRNVRFATTSENSVVVVPKNWKTGRTIAKEPTHSVPFQLALDTYIKRRLLRWGVDLRDQTKNQEYARLGSIDGSYATIDLEGASDSLSLSAVDWMLPPDWRALLGAFRSSRFRAKDSSGEYAKFSSMGNGVTFSLESLIFAACCRAVGSRDFCVYGDDIIVRTHLVAPLLKLLAFLGFKVNQAKSYVNPDSRFRESCGFDAYRGRRVTPFYLREVPKSRDKSSICHAINGFLSCGAGEETVKLCRRLVMEHKLQLVPYNSDSRSGVFVDVHTAYRMKLLRKGRPTARNKECCYSLYYAGYGQSTTRRETVGWRSLLLWYLRKEASGDAGWASTLPAKSSGAMLLGLRSRDPTPSPDIVTTSAVGVRSTYVHKTRVFYPEGSGTPLYLSIWSDAVAPKSGR